MVSLICGLSLCVYGRKIQEDLNEVFFTFSSFMITLAYTYEYFVLNPSICLIASAIAAGLGFTLYRKVLKNKLLYTYGVTVGTAAGLTTVYLFDLLGMQTLVYPLVLASGIFGIAAYFKTDEFFTYISHFVGGLLTV